MTGPDFRRCAALLDALALGVIVLDEVERIVLWNQWMEDSSGFSRESVVGRAFRDVFPELEDHRVHQAAQDALRYRHPALLAESLHHAPFPLRRGTQRQRIAQSVRVTPIGHDDSGCLIQITDVTMAIERERVLRDQTLALREAQQRQLALLNGIADRAWLKDTAGRHLAVNQAFAGESGLTIEQMIGRTDFELFPPDLAACRREEDLVVMRDAAMRRSEEVRYREDGQECWEEKVKVPVLDTKGNVIGTAGTARDVTERKLAERRVHHLAHHDNLTGLANRVLLADRLDLSMADAARAGLSVGVLFVDLDRFKLINDSLGHDVGDDLLRAVADRLKEKARSVDTVARLGGDEFVVILQNVRSNREVAQVARKIRDKLDQPYVLGGHTLQVTPSIGISLFPRDGITLDELLKSADSAMYRAKHKGRNGFEFYSPEMAAGARERLSIEQALRSALDRDELVLYFQPQVDLRSGRILTAEVLLRWRHPELGLLEPTHFIAIAEDTGLILPIGEWVLRTTCEQSRQWQEQGVPPLTLAVNLSALQFRQQGLARFVARVLRDTEVAADHLELELTESAMMDGAATAVQTLHTLKEMRLRLSIDDFGTGYSSLGYLKRFPIDKLKIDQTFVRDVTSDADDAAITKAIIALGKAMQLTVVAEGVETQGQLDFLRQHECDEVQGYLQGRPMPAEAFATMFTDACLAVAEPA